MYKIQILIVFGTMITHFNGFIQTQFFVFYKMFFKLLYLLLFRVFHFKQKTSADILDYASNSSPRKISF